MGDEGIEQLMNITLCDLVANAECDSGDDENIYHESPVAPVPTDDCRDE